MPNRRCRKVFVARLDRLVDFRDPLGPAAKHFLAQPARRLSGRKRCRRRAHGAARIRTAYFLTPDGTCYHGRMVSGGRQGEAGPLALKRELRQHEAEAARLARIAQSSRRSSRDLENEIEAREAAARRAMAQHVEAEKSLVAATHQRDQARSRIPPHRAAACAGASGNCPPTRRSRKRPSARRAGEPPACRSAEFPRSRGSRSRRGHRNASQNCATIFKCFRSESSRGAKSSPRCPSAWPARTPSNCACLAKSRRPTERIGVAPPAARGSPSGEDRSRSVLRTTWPAGGRTADEKNSGSITTSPRSNRNGTTARSRAGQIDETLRGRRQSLDELRAERSQRQIEKARNDADRDYLRQTCVAELNAQPEELMALVGQEEHLLVGENLVAAETNYNEMKARVEAMGAVNMMALEEFQECEQREAFPPARA